MRRTENKIKFKLNIWKQDAKKYYCESADLANAIAEGNVETQEIQRRMGHGYVLLIDALKGARLDQYDVQMIEHGILPHQESSVKPWAISDEQLYGDKKKD